jgi:hypothetical protein
MYSANGIDYSNKGVTFTFDRNDGALCPFADTWDLYKVRGETVTINFLTDVVGIDISKYNRPLAKLSFFRSYRCRKSS